MNRFVHILYGCLPLLLLFSCTSQKQTDLSQYTGKRIVLGSGGGFTGLEKQYCLLENGQLFYRTSSDTTFIIINTKTKKIARPWFAAYDSLALDQTNFNQPGNVYRFIGINEGKSTKRISWGSGQTQPDKKITTFYEGFIKFWIP